MSHIADKLADANQYGYAVQAAKMITSNPQRNLVLTNICNKQAAAGQYDQAKKTLSETLQIVNSTKGSWLDSADVVLNAADIYI